MQFDVSGFAKSGLTFAAKGRVPTQSRKDAKEKIFSKKSATVWHGHI
jgi:hypothetical protein